tara:strand:- start:1843 stop:3219 length:1377 start_codon:yes stop_codon:yes gene_type:complete
MATLYPDGKGGYTPINPAIANAKANALNNSMGTGSLFNYSALNQRSPYLARTNQPMQEMANVRRVQPQGYPSLGGQMKSMGLPMPTGQAGQKQTAANTPPNWRKNLLNYIVSPKGQGMAQGLLEASGYSKTPVSFGQAMALGMQRGNQAEATAAASQLAKDKFAYQKSQDLITNLLAQTGLDIEGKKIKPQDKFEQIEIEVPDGKGGKIKVQANRNLVSGKVTPVMSGSGTNINLGQGSGGWKTVNTNFGAEINEWVLSGGFTGSQANLIKIDDAIEQLEKSKDEFFGLTGKNVGVIPKGARAIFNPDSADLEDNIRSIIYESLRQTLGAQFAEREGEKLIQASFNAMLSEEKNIVRLKRMKAKILEMAKAKQKAYEYFQSNDGDMSGYSGSTFVFENESQIESGADDFLSEFYNVDDYKGLDDTAFTKYFTNATGEEQAWILQNAENIPQIKIGAEE